jgi:hypothetical protein
MMLLLMNPARRGACVFDCIGSLGMRRWGSLPTSPAHARQRRPRVPPRHCQGGADPQLGSGASCGKTDGGIDDEQHICEQGNYDAEHDRQDRGPATDQPVPIERFHAHQGHQLRRGTPAPDGEVSRTIRNLARLPQPAAEPHHPQSDPTTTQAPGRTGRSAQPTHGTRRRRNCPSSTRRCARRLPAGARDGDG